MHPDAFSARRTKLTVAAKQRGDAVAAKRLAGARKPTTAAWIVNRVGDAIEVHGLLTPARTKGGTRRYSPADLARN